ncbi:hypothetical protein SDC9_84066 [bioreactor metagenome]|uniref:CheW-like domain-containing protein n=1 Tax=bioreactor metagenome TaxID=1076179 RepID=A0A644Z9T1_9ZZZZ
MNVNRQETPAERKTRIFRERAKKLAAPGAARDSGGESLELLEFLIGKERYAVETVFVGEVFPPGDITPVPCTPPFVAGVVNLRGRIVPVVDLKVFFGIRSVGEKRRSRIVLLQSGGAEIGLLTDGVQGIEITGREAVRPPLSAQGGLPGAYMTGIAGNDLAVLDGDRILRDIALTVDEEP